MNYATIPIIYEFSLTSTRSYFRKMKCTLIKVNMDSKRKFNIMFSILSLLLLEISVCCLLPPLSNFYYFCIKLFIFICQRQYRYLYAQTKTKNNFVCFRLVKSHFKSINYSLTFVLKWLTISCAC